jgi:alanine racemase
MQYICIESRTCIGTDMIYLDYLLEATKGVLRYQGKQNQFATFSHDTRQVVPGEMFVAVQGIHNNGHDYLLDAVRLGATGLLVEADALNALSEQMHATLSQADVTVVVVENTRIALPQYASAILKRWHPTVIAVAGGVGKTSTKEAIATVLASRFKTFRSWQNYNDLLGIPLSLGRLEEEHEYVVLELGCDHPGEITDLCRIIHPQIGVLTNISPVQLQYFGSVEHLADELGALVSSLPEGGRFFYNQDDEASAALVARNKNSLGNITFHSFALSSRISTQAGAHPDLHACVTDISWDGVCGELIQPVSKEQASNDISSNVRNVPIVSRPEEAAAYLATLQPRDVRNIPLVSHLLGEHHLYTMLTACQIGITLGMSMEEVQQALVNVVPMPGRLNPLPGVCDSRLLDDTHNASPASMLAGLATLDALTPATGRRIAVLGDMLNLGYYQEKAHRELGQQIPDFVDYLITHGESAALIAEAAKQVGMDSAHIITTSTHEDAAQIVRSLLEQSRDLSQQPNEGPEFPSNHSPSVGAAIDGPRGVMQDVVLVKGSEETRMERVTEMLMARPWEASEKLVRQAPGWKKTIFRHADRPTWVEIDLNAIASNARHIKSLVGPNVQVMAALKADAYGHGALKVARTVLHNGASMLGVATVSEAAPLREANISAPILVFGYVPLWQMREAIRLDVRVTLYSTEAAYALSRAALDLSKTVKVHVKVDTGMGRLGIRHEQMNEIVALVRLIKVLPGLELEGLYTHFAQADAESKTHAHLQLERFLQVLHALREQGLRPPIVHAANSAAMLVLPAAHFDMVRPGIAIYGLQPSPVVHLPDSFRPALSFKTQVSQVKWLSAGEGISYGSIYVTTHPTCIAVLPVGYADGFRRAPLTWGTVLIHGQEAAILGRVCMDQCMVDVTNIPQTRMGDEVVLIGRQGEATLTAEQVAEHLGTINYEVVSEILARVPRVD